jgi:ATP/maltotriose-dependent transcriptional regulator MalT
MEGLAILLVLSAVAFRIDDGKSRWVWGDYPMFALILVLIVISIAMLWIRIEKRKMDSIVDTLKANMPGDSTIREAKLNGLSAKQREVFNLIVQGKSNKEIISEMVIELSTLKSHINQIYKKLGISSRREAQTTWKPTNTKD